MYIYKVTNIINGKLYIGQTTRFIQDRWERHINDALSNRLDTHFARAIRKYGPENFVVEQIDVASSQEELNKKEIYWIKFYNTVKNGYNMTDGAVGGNTYKCKTEKEMDEIKNKIRNSKLKDKNPNAKKVKCKNVLTNEEHHFNSFEECVDFFNEGNHAFITKRCKEELKYVYKGEWVFAYEENEYINDYYFTKHQRRQRNIFVIDLLTGEEKEFNSYSEAKTYFNVDYRLSPHNVKNIGETFIIHNRFQITVLS